jgi:leucyl/phenylalanyl-tRNA--protein transferase
MDRIPRDHRHLTPGLLLRAYATGIFPMAEGRDEKTVFWVDPEQRGILPLDQFHLPRRLSRTVRNSSLEVRADTAFEAVIQACSEPAAERLETWINDEIIRSYTQLHRLGFAHSVECWRGEHLVGGLYGIALGGAFFGESMMSRERDASKIALVHLVARLRHGGYTLLDCQFITQHLKQFGTIEVLRERYLELLGEAFLITGEFYREMPAGYLEASLLELTQSRTQTS